eukprot:826813_1
MGKHAHNRPRHSAQFSCSIPSSPQHTIATAHNRTDLYRINAWENTHIIVLATAHTRHSTIVLATAHNRTDLYRINTADHHSITNRNRTSVGFISYAQCRPVGVGFISMFACKDVRTLLHHKKKNMHNPHTEAHHRYGAGKVSNECDAFDNCLSD